MEQKLGADTIWRTKELVESEGDSGEMQTKW